MFGHTEKETDENPFAIVTGASSGLGEAMVKSLLEKGYEVIGLSRTGLNLDDDESYTDLECDIRDLNQIEKAFEEIESLSGGRVELLVNSAGICEMGEISETTSKDFKNHLETNTLGTFHVLKYYEDLIVDGESQIINILSTAAKYAYPNVTAYNASKFGLYGLLQSCEREWEKRGVRFTNIFPGAVNTPLWDKLGVEFSREKMLSIDEYMYVFNTIVDAPMNIRFADITFLHKEGILK